MARVFVITGPSGVGKGTLIRTLRERMPELELSVSATTRAPRPGEQDGVDYHFLERLQISSAASTQATSSSTPTTPAAATARCARSSSAATAAGHPVVLEIELQGARQVRAAMPEAVQVFIAPPSLDALRARLVGRGTDDHDEVAARLRVAERSSPPRTSSATWSSTTASRTPPRSSWRSSPPACRSPSSPHKNGPASTAGVGRAAGTLGSMIYPRIDTLLEHVDSNYASVLVAAKRARQINSYYHNLGEGTFDEFPPPMVDTRSKNYLTIALEEVAAGKIKYHYR